MSTRRAAAVIGTIVVAVTTLVGPNPPAAEAQFADRLDLIGQTLFVTDDPVTIDLRLPRNLTDRQLEVRVHAPLTDTDDLADAFAAPPVDDVISLFSITDLEELAVGAGDIISITLPDDEIGEILRRDPGVLPIVIDLVDAEQTVDTLITGVIVEDATRGATIEFGFVADARSPLAHRADGTIDVDPQAVAERVEDAVADAPGPTLVQFSPETLTALADTRTENGQATIDEIRRHLDGHHLDSRPWVDLDVEAWRRAGENGRIFDQYAEGASMLETYLGRSPGTIGRIDPTSGPETLELLRQIGITAGVVEPDRLRGPDLIRAARRPLQTRDVNGVSFTVLPIDRAFEASLTGNDPEVVAVHHFLRLLLEARNAPSDRAIVVDLDTIDRLLLDALLTLTETTPRLGIASIEDLLAAPPARNASGAVLRVELTTDEPADVSGGASDMRLTESTLGSYVGMVAPADDPILPLRTLLSASMSSELDEEQRRAYTDAVFSTVVDGTANFQVLEAERITLATRRANLPLVVRNEQPVPINVVVRLTSEKLRLPGGDELALTLAPGDTELTIPVESVSSGDARILVRITSPDGVLDLASGSINVRSTAISGLGLIVSLLSLSVLLTWWARTIWRVRANRRTASVAGHPATSDDEPDSTSPPDPEPDEEPST